MVLTTSAFPGSSNILFSSLVFLLPCSFVIALEEAGVYPVPCVGKCMHTSWNPFSFLFNEVCPFYMYFTYWITDGCFSRYIRKRNLRHWPDVSSSSDIANVKLMLAGNFLPLSSLAAVRLWGILGVNSRCPVFP